MPLYTLVVIGSWALFILFWAVSAFGVKRDIRGGGFAGTLSRFFVVRLVALAVIVFLLTRVLGGTAHYSRSGAFIFTQGVFVPPLALDWLGAILTALGVLFAIWARIHLGRNWSAAPSVKENHELVTSGPYEYVRHPIYTGLILAALGATLTGTFFGVVVLIIALAVFLLRIKKEEGIMLELFPDAYPAYQARTKRLIPFVW